MLAARLDPLYRAADVPGGERDQEIVGVEFAAHAEGAAGVALHHADVGLRHAEQRREDAPAQERRLGRAPERELLASGVPLREHAARLHRHRRVAVSLEALLAPVRRGGECCFHIALHAGQDQRTVGRLTVEEMHGAFRRIGTHDDR